MPHKGKRFTALMAKVDLSKRYDPEEAIKLLAEMKTARR